MLLIGQPLRTRLSLLGANTIDSECTVQGQFQPGLLVYLRDFRPQNPKWLPGVFEARLGTYLYQVRHGEVSQKKTR